MFAFLSFSFSDSRKLDEVRALCVLQIQCQQIPILGLRMSWILFIARFDDKGAGDGQTNEISKPQKSRHKQKWHLK